MEGIEEFYLKKWYILWGQVKAWADEKIMGETI